MNPIELDELGPGARAAAHARSRADALAWLRRRHRGTVPVQHRSSGRSVPPGRSARPGSATSRSTSSRRSPSPGCCSSPGTPSTARLAARDGARGRGRGPGPGRSPRRCGGRPNARSIRACFPATSSSRRAPRCCAAGSARASNCTGTTGCRCRWRSARRVHRRHPGEPDPADRLRADARACRGVDAESQRMLRRLLRDFADVTPLSRGDPIPLAGDQAQRPLPHGAAPGRARPARDLR